MPCETSGLWTQNTVRNVATHPLLVAIWEYGKRSGGDQLRFTKDGPRPLGQADFDRVGTRRTVTNPADQVIRTPAKGEPVTTPEQYDRVRAVIESRGRHLKGKARTRERSGGAARTADRCPPAGPEHEEPQQQVEAAVGALDRLADSLASGTADWSAVGTASPSPGPLYTGPTDRPIIRRMLAAGEPVTATPGHVAPGDSDAGQDVRGSVNVQRGTMRFT